MSAEGAGTPNPESGRLDEDVNGALISGRRAPDGSGWCWYCNRRHERVTTKRTPCCGDCWYDEPPPVDGSGVSR